MVCPTSYILFYFVFNWEEIKLIPYILIFMTIRSVEPKRGTRGNHHIREGQGGMAKEGKRKFT